MSLLERIYNICVYKVFLYEQDMNHRIYTKGPEESLAIVPRRRPSG